MRARPIVHLAALAVLVACKRESPPAPTPDKPAAKPAEATPAAPAKPPTFITAQSGRSDPECVGPIDLAVPAELSFGARKAELNGYSLAFKDHDTDDQAVLGVLANINEDSGDNLFNLKRYLEFFKKESVEAIVVAGDTGESAESIERALQPLAESGMPVFVVIGNRECKGDYNDAVLALQKTFPNVVNLNRVRYVDYDDADLASLPGYHDRRFIHCATGCVYYKQDVEALQAELVKRRASGGDPVVLVSHGPPHGETLSAIDAATEVGNVGDPALGVLIEQAGVPFGIFANIKEGGGKATDLRGLNMIKEHGFVDALYLNPGPADSIAWNLNDGTESRGMAAVLTVKGKQAKYKIYRAKALSPGEKAHASRLAPPKGGGEDEVPVATKP